MKSNELTGFISEKYKKPSVCESCGNEFLCGAELKNCWCLDTKLDDEARAKLKTNFNDCLCRKCLEKYAVK